jgi:hypothetical protein
MTSIRDIPYEDIKVFLDANDKTFGNKDEAYKIAFKLLNNPMSKGHTTRIIEWIMAYNLLQNNVKIPMYTIYDIDNMPQEEINKLARLLMMKHNNRTNIKNILRYLHKLDEKIIINPDISSLIFPILDELELKEIDLAELRYDDVINLLKTHRNKKIIRNFIFDNLDKIIIYNTYDFDFDDYVNYNGDYNDFMIPNINIYNKDIIVKIILDNKEKLRKSIGGERLSDLIKEIKENQDDDGGEIYTGKSEMYNLTKFTFDLFEINEIDLAKRVFDISNKLHLYGRSYSYNVELIDHMLNTENIITVIDWMGDDEFLKSFDQLEISHYNYDEYDKDIKNLVENLINLGKSDLSALIFEEYINKFTPKEYRTNKIVDTFKMIIKNLAELQKYDLLIEIFEHYLNWLPLHKKKRLRKILDNIEKAISNNDNDLVLQYTEENEL